MTRVLHRTILIPYLFILIALVQIVVWSAERRPPMVVKDYAALNAHEGGRAFFAVNTEREMGRDCDVMFTRYMMDARGYRYDLLGTQMMSAQAVSRLEQPSQMLLSLRVPSEAHAGPAKLILDMSYTCNPVHQFWPITQVLSFNFTILQP